MEGSRIQGSKGSSDPPQNRRIKMLKNYISYGSVCELGTLKKDRAERSFKKPLNPGPLGFLDPFLQLNWRRTKNNNAGYLMVRITVPGIQLMFINNLRKKAPRMWKDRSDEPQYRH